MSESTYRRMRALGWATENSSTCFPQAYDRITVGAGVSMETYQSYGETMKRWDDVPSSDMNTNRHNATIARLYGLIAEDLGGYSLQDMVFEDAKKAARLKRILEELFDSNYNPVIDIATRDCSVHSLGVKRLDTGLYKFVGTGIPPLLQGAVSADIIEHMLHHVGNSNGFTSPWPFVATNISALPYPPRSFVQNWEFN